MPGPESEEKKVPDNCVKYDICPPKKDTFQKYEDGANKGKKILPKLKATAISKSGEKIEKSIVVNDKIDCVTYHIYWNTETEGKIEKHIPKEITKGYVNKYQYIYHDKEGKEHEICTVDWYTTTEMLKGNIKGAKNVELIDIRQFKGYESSDKTIRAKFLTLNSDSQRWYINPSCFAALLGAMLDLNIDYVGFNGFSDSLARSVGGSSSHRNGEKGDLRYLSKNKKGERTLLQDSFFDCDMQNKFNDSLYKYGWGRLEKMYSEYFTYKGNKNYLLNHTKHMRKDGTGGYRHHHHLHLCGFNQSLIKTIDEKD